MSYLVRINVEARDPVAVLRAADKLGAKARVYEFRGRLTHIVDLGEHRLVVETGTGEVAYDSDYGSGAVRSVEAFTQRYAAEKFRLDREALGLEVHESEGPDGALVLWSPDTAPAETGLELTAPAAGESVLRPVGHKGPGCRGAGAAAESALGAVGEYEYAPEYYESVVEGERLQAGH